MAELIRREDDLNTGREKLNNAIVNADEAKKKSNQAINISEQAKQIAQTAENKADNVQEQINQVVIEGDSSVEAAQARVDADGNVFTTLKERLDTKETQFSSQLADNTNKIGILSGITGVSIREFSDVNDDWTNAFVQACNKAITNNVPLLLGNGTFTVDASKLSSPVNIPSIIGVDAQKTKLKLIGNVLFKISSGFKLKDLTIETDYMVSNANNSVSNFLSADSAISDIEIRNVNYINTNSITDGTYRGNTFLRVTASNVLVDNVTVVGSRTPFVITNGFDQKCKNITFKNIRIENFQTGFYLSASPIVAGLTSDDFISDVTFENITAINTDVQQQNFSKINGSDLFMFERVKNIKFSNIYCERACERVAYLNCCENVVANNALNKNAEGWKFVGFVDTSQGISYIADGFKASNFRFDGGKNQATNAFIFYEAKNVFVDGVDIIGGYGASSTFNSGFYFERYTENITIRNVRAQNMMRGIVEFYMLYSPTYTTQTKRVNLENLEVFNPVLIAGYPLIKTYVDPELAGQYVFKDIRIVNCFAKQNVTPSGTILDVKDYNANSLLKGLVDIDQVDGFRSSGNRLEGYSNTCWLKIGANSRDVIISERMKIADLNRIPSNVFVSAGSIIEHYNEDRPSSGAVRGILLSLSNNTDDYKTMDLSTAVEAKFEGGIKMIDGKDYLLPWNSNAKTAFGTITTSTGEYIQFMATPSAVTKISGSDNSDVANTPGKLCVYLSGGNLYFRNRLGGSVYVTFDYHVTCRVENDES